MSFLKMRRWPRRVIVTIALLVVAAVVLDQLFPLPLPQPGARVATVVLARDGTPLRAFPDAQGVWRYPTTAGDVSPLYLEALIGYEDQWFWQHPGVNPWALLRAAWQWAASGHVVSGGSTLTMQVARLLCHMPRTVPGKFLQILRALQLEIHLSKKEILTLYLNHAPFGGGIRGVETASWAYLGKSAAHLSHAEAALVAVLPQAPSRLRPDRHPERARKARDKVLRRLAEEGAWTARTVAAARIEPVMARSLEHPMLAPLLAQRLHAAQPQARRIETTIDAGLQAAIEARVRSYMARLPPRTSAAVLVMENVSGAVRVYVGSADFANRARLGYLDMVQAWRSPGSTLKPFLYGMALDDGLIHSASLLLDVPQDFGGYRPGNFGGGFHGPVSAADALRWSLNVPAVALLQRVGPARFAARLANAGLKLRLPATADPNLSIILGGTAVRLEDLVSAYTAFNNGGIAVAPRLQTDVPVQRRRVLSPGAAWIVRHILNRHPRPGYTLADLRHSDRPPLAWKTGTSYGSRDTWAVASTPRYAIGVWIGRPDGTPMPGQYGAVTALPLLFQVADTLPQDQGGASPPPPAVKRTTICWPLGRRPDPEHPALCQQRLQAWILDGVLPPTLPLRANRSWGNGKLRLRVDTDSGKRLSAGCHRPHEDIVLMARWPSAALPWLDPAERQRNRLPPLAPGCADDGLGDAQTLHISGIVDGASVRSPPGSELPPRLSLNAIGSRGKVMWLINGRLVDTTESDEAFVHDYAQPGTKAITAIDSAGGWARIRVRIEG